MTVFVFVGCATETPNADWDTGGEDGGWDWGGSAEEEVEEEGDPAPTGDSCTITSDICIAAGEPDNQAWCEGLGLTYSADACATGYTGWCALPAGGDFTAPATGYYYNSIDGEGACTGAGGTYTAAM